MEGYGRLFELAKPYLVVVFVQFGYAGMTILAKSALDKGMSPHVFVVYRHAVATLVIAPFAIIFDRFYIILDRLATSFSFLGTYLMLGITTLHAGMILSTLSINSKRPHTNRDAFFTYKLIIIL